MKLKYYLRGLGIGIVVAVIITSISMGNRQPMTDEEIKARAAELGMIENSVLSDIANKDDEAIKNDEPAKDDEALQDNEPVIDEPTQDEPTQDEPTQDEEQLEEEEKNDEPAENEENNQQSNQQSNDKNTVSITVVSGDSSWTVSKRMEEAGLIESAKDFDTHLCRYGYDKKISVGTYKIPVTATHEEMAKILTRMD